MVLPSCQDPGFLDGIFKTRLKIKYLDKFRAIDWGPKVWISNQSLEDYVTTGRHIFQPGPNSDQELLGHLWQVGTLTIDLLFTTKVATKWTLPFK